MTTPFSRAAASRTKTKVIRFAAYLRCSSDDNAAGDFTTIDNQRAMAKEYIDRRIAEIVAKGGQAEFVGFYDDEGKTGTNLRRRGYVRLRTDAQAGVLTVVVVTYMSRLGRGSQFDIAEHELAQAGASVELIQEHFTPDMAGHVNKRVKNLMDELYPIQVSEWTKTKQVGMVAAGYFTGGRVPFGYRSEPVPGMEPVTLAGGKVKPPPKRLVPFEEEAAHVRQAMESFVARRNMGDALRYLRLVVPGRVWSMDQTRWLLTNDVYRGVQRFGANVNETAHEAIVGEQLWDAVQAALATRQEAREQQGIAAVADRPLVHEKAHRSDPLPYYLRGAVYCVHCGCRMTPTGNYGRGDNKIGYYVCIRGGNGSKSATGCPCPRVNSKRLHEYVLGEIERVATYPTRFDTLLRDTVRALPSSTNLKDDLARARRNQREAERKIEKLVTAIKSGGAATVKILTAEIEEESQRLDDWTKQVAALESAIEQSTARRPDGAALRELWGGFLSNWAYLEDGERTELLPLVVDRVEMEEKTKGVLHLILQNALRGVGVSSPVWVRIPGELRTTRARRSTSPILRHQPTNQTFHLPPL